MRVLAGALWTEALRYAYAMSVSRWSEMLPAVALAVLVISLLGWRLRGSVRPTAGRRAMRRRRVVTARGGFDSPVVGGYRRA
jgi:hypothetical protein